MLLHFVAFTPEIHIIKNEFRQKGGITWDFLPSIVAVAACMICCYWRRKHQSSIQLIEKGNRLIQIIQRTPTIPYRDVNAFILIYIYIYIQYLYMGYINILIILLTDFSTTLTCNTSYPKCLYNVPPLSWCKDAMILEFYLFFPW